MRLFTSERQRGSGTADNAQQSQGALCHPQERSVGTAFHRALCTGVIATRSQQCLREANSSEKTPMSTSEQDLESPHSRNLKRMNCNSRKSMEFVI